MLRLSACPARGPLGAVPARLAAFHLQLESQHGGWDATPRCALPVLPTLQSIYIHNSCTYDNQAAGISGSYDVSMLGKYTFRATCGSYTNYGPTPPEVSYGSCWSVRDRRWWWWRARSQGGMSRVLGWDLFWVPCDTRVCGTRRDPP